MMELWLRGAIRSGEHQRNVQQLWLRRMSLVQAVAGVARRHGIVASQLSSWRTAAKRRATMDNTRSQSFAAITVVPDGSPHSFDGIEVAVGAVSVRLPKRIADIAQRLVQAK
ncbi:MAG: hypothetical protein ABJI95_06635 [Paracoccaceae bacterium]